MRTSKISTIIAGLIIAGSLVVTSCRKKEKTEATEPDNEQTSAADNAMAENALNDIASMGSQVSETGGLTLNKSSNGSDVLMFAAGCATITSNAVGTVVATQYTVDFGSACTSTLDGRTRKGKLFYNFSGSYNKPWYKAKYYRNPGFNMVVTSSGYEVDGNQINIINKTVTNVTDSIIRNQASFAGYYLKWKITADISIVKAGGAGTVTWKCNRDKELINSNDPLCYKGQQLPIDWTKAKIKLNGKAEGTNAKGEAYTAVATDLERHFTCAPGANPHRHPFVAGKVLYTPGNRPPRLIDYGTGYCDFNASITINGQTFTMTIQ